MHVIPFPAIPCICFRCMLIMFFVFWSSILDCRPTVKFVVSSFQVLSTLKVQKLIIPAISEHMHTWTVGFGFNSLEDSSRLEMKSINMLVFPGTDMLQKRFQNGETLEGNIIIKFLLLLFACLFRNSFSIF